jgi:hypothetical protein
MTSETDHDLLVRIDTQVQDLRRTLDVFTTESHIDRRHLWDKKADKAITEDHERRLRITERMLYIGLGGLLTIQIISYLLYLKR